MHVYAYMHKIIHVLLKLLIYRSGSLINNYNNQNEIFVSSMVHLNIILFIVNHVIYHFPTPCPCWRNKIYLFIYICQQIR